MDQKNVRKQVYINYYTLDDYNKIIAELPDITVQAERKSMEVMEPTIVERKAVRNFIREYIKTKNRKVYGGTAVDELLKNKDPSGGIYDEYCTKDIEFYSFTPVPDMADLCNQLFKAGFKFVQGREAQHEETYSIFVNFNLYCDITYVPANVYHGIKTININGINFIDPHFIYIDHLRIYNAPMTAYCLWEKIFKRSYKLLKHYPLEYYSKPIEIASPTKEFQSYFQKIKSDFLTRADIRDTTLLGGFDAYNFYIRQATSTSVTDSDTLARVRAPSANAKKSTPDQNITPIPYVELVSVNYQETAIAMFDYITTLVEKKSKSLLTVEEAYPLFQFTGYSVLIKYDNKPVAKIYEADGFCVPVVRLKSGIKYVSFQYILMMLFMHKFKSHLDQNKEMYLNYGSAISHLIGARNGFLERNNLLLINNTIFSEFRINCTGDTVSSSRSAFLRRIKYKKPLFIYTPEDHLKKSEEDQKKFDPKKKRFKNTSGNTIVDPKYQRFKLDDKLNLIISDKTKLDIEPEPDTDSSTDSDTDSDTKTEIEAETETETEKEIID